MDGVLNNLFPGVDLFMCVYICTCNVNLFELICLCQFVFVTLICSSQFVYVCVCDCNAAAVMQHSSPI